MKSWDIVLPVASVIAIYGARMAELRTKRDTVPGSVRETLTLRLFMLAGALMLVGSNLEFFLRGLTLKWWTFAAGWLCSLASFAIRRRAIAALGKFWSLHVEIRENHQFVQAGPFRWVRHPTYFSMILELLGLGLIMNAVYSLLAAAICFVPTLALRLKLEETALVDKFGDAYREYQRTTPALFPYKVPRTK
jgi:protein-S-isoprenylcysteine O-methyltransferase Ste14